MSKLTCYVMRLFFWQSLAIHEYLKSNVKITDHFHCGITVQKNVHIWRVRKSAEQKRKNKRQKKRIQFTSQLFAALTTQPFFETHDALDQLGALRHLLGPKHHSFQPKVVTHNFVLRMWKITISKLHLISPDRFQFREYMNESII